MKPRDSQISGIFSATGSLIQAIGSGDFDRQLIDLAQTLIDHDHLGCHVFVMSCQTAPQCTVPLFVHSHDGGNSAKMAGHSYINRWWQDDPDMRTLASRSSDQRYFASILPTAEIRSVGYVRDCAEPCNVGERIAFTYGYDRHHVSLRLYRRQGSRAISASQWRQLNPLGELLSSICFKQWQALEHGGRNPPAPGIDRLRARALDNGAALSRRELQVMEAILAGMTAAQIAELLRVSETTVVTTRSRAYFKLDLHSISEIYRYCMASPQ
ncbi:MAG: helix-turn-helix transcriptional regulator [Burkholderiales bacterium]|nr:helix-turn-helix transcriptional regulator [Burkholderiales bacterium]